MMQGFEPWLNRPLSIQVHLPTLNSQQNLQPTCGSQDSAPRCRTAIIQAVEIETQEYSSRRPHAWAKEPVAA